jgi:hypothetical protein
MFRDNFFSKGGTPTHTLPPTQLPLDEQLSKRLHDLLQRLQLILPVINVVTLALRLQNAEQDVDIAAVLMRHAGDPLNMEIAKLEGLLDTRTAGRHAEGVAA